MQSGVLTESDPQIGEGSELLQLEAEKPHGASGLRRAAQRQRASFRQDGIEVERCARVLRHPSGKLVLDRLDEIGHTRPQRGVRLAFLQRRGQIDFR